MVNEVIVCLFIVLAYSAIIRHFIADLNSLKLQGDAWKIEGHEYRETRGDFNGFYFSDHWHGQLRNKKAEEKESLGKKHFTRTQQYSLENEFEAEQGLRFFFFFFFFRFSEQER